MTAPVPIALDAVRLRDDWRATVSVERDDSIVLTLPSGDQQLQRFHRAADFTLSVSPAGVASIRLDSLRTIPAMDSDSPGGAHAVWIGRVGDPAVNAFRPASGNAAAAELTAVVRALLPRLPASGALPRSGWTDSATGTTSSDMFTVTERRTASWSAGSTSKSADGDVTPIQLREDFEQSGEGSRDGRSMTLTAQGRRTGTYYVRSDGRVTRAQLADSSALSIGIPQTHELMSGTRHSHTVVRFSPISI